MNIIAVLVLYRCSLQESASWQSIRQQVQAQPGSGLQLMVCINGVSAADRTAVSLSLPADLPGWVQVVSVTGNYGLAWAYEYALTMAKQSGVHWLLTLDQDTELPNDFLPGMQRRAHDLSSDGRIGAIVPRLVNDRGKALSPLVAGIRERIIAVEGAGIVPGEVRAYNSGALIRVAALQEIGGYDRRFWLDYLDHALFHTLHVHGFQVWVEGDLALRHQLSLEDGREAMTKPRFHNFARAEAAFRDLHVGLGGRLLYLGRLMLRAVNQKRRSDPPHFFHTTVGMIRERLFISRRERLRRWEASVAGVVSEPEITMHRPALEIGW